MAKARHILKRVRAVRGIHTITRTMQMVSSARFRRVHQTAVSARPYTDRLASLVGDLVERNKENPLHHPLLDEVQGVQRDIMLVLTSNSGLCGAYNNSVLQIADERLSQLRHAGYEVVLYVVGKRGMQHMQFAGETPAHAITDLGYRPPYDKVAVLADDIMGQFLARRISGLEVVYTQFISSGRQRPVVAPLLPMSHIPAPAKPPIHRTPALYEVLPSVPRLLERLLPVTFRLRLYQYFLDSAIAEQMARMTAMQSASTNAQDMLKDLTRLYNRTRQTQITTELTEIIGGSEGFRQ